MAPGRVLTAAHVVAGARSVRVLLDVGQDAEVEVIAEDWWDDPRTDLAVLMIPVEAAASRECSTALFGRISETAAVLTVHASGFPLFKARDTPPGEGEAGVFRDFEQASGHAPVAANRRQGTLAVYLDDPAPDLRRADGLSPWEGMSGAAVWAAGRIVGVVSEHYPAEGAGRLAARRIDHAYGQLRPPDLGLLSGLLSLPAAVEALRDVVPAGPRQLVRTAYLAQVRDIAPDALVGRDSELAQWSEFCAGPMPYAWWQAGPWAGKSALASWFVTHPPAGVDVVAFFITSRLKGQADSAAFLDAMTEQLGVLADPADQTSAPVAGALVGAWLSMLESAAARSAERGRRLVVVVDGLDEDEAGAVPGRGRASIASLLPRRPPQGARFIITSRPDPGLPDDVPAHHPLRACQPVALPQSWVAKEAESLAKQELGGLLSGDQAEIDTVGYIAGSGGGLTRTDLSELTAVPSARLDRILRGVFGRSLHARAAKDPRHAQRDDADRVYLFGHETLRVIAEELLGKDLGRYRQDVHEWIDSYAQAGWPDTTPGYAIRGYPRLLADNDLTRLSAFARDRRRHEFLLRATGSDHTALTEISTALQLIAGQDYPDLKATAELAARWHVLSTRNQFIPNMLPAAWALLGRFDHAEALARSMPSHEQSGALALVAGAIAWTGDYERAEATASVLPVADGQAEALARVAAAIAEAGDYERAETTAVNIPDSGDQDEALALVAVVIARAGHRERAAALARTISGPTGQIQVLADLAGIAAEADDYRRASDLVAEAEAIVGAATYSDEQAWAQVLEDLAAAATRAGDYPCATRLASQVESIARAMTEPYWRAGTLAAVASLAAEAGDYERARRLAFEAESANATEPDSNYKASEQVRSYDLVAGAFADAGDYDRAEAIGLAIARARWGEHLYSLPRALAKAGQHDRVEALVRAVADADGRDHMLARFVHAIAEAGHYDRAEDIARTSTDPETRASALARVVGELADARQYDRAEALARALDVNSDGRYAALGDVAAAIAEAGDYDRAEDIARAMAGGRRKLDKLIDVAIAAAKAGDHDYASRLASEVENAARSFTVGLFRDEALGQIAAATAKAGDYDRAEVVADAMEGPFERAQVLVRIAVITAGAGDHDRARSLARDAGSLARTSGVPTHGGQGYIHVREYIDLAISIAQLGEHDLAETLARSVIVTRDPNSRVYNLGDIGVHDRVRALAGVAAVMSQNGDSRHARELADEAENIARGMTHPADRIRSLTHAAAVMSQVGDRHRARALAADAEDAARTATIGTQAEALRCLAVDAAQAGEHDRAEAIARTITVPYRVEVLLEMAAKTSDRDHSRQLATDAEAAARTIEVPFQQAQALSSAARAMAQAGDQHRARQLAADAEATARTIEVPFEQAQALSSAARAMAQAGDQHRARQLAAEAAESATSIDAPHPKQLAELAISLSEAGASLHATRLFVRALAMDDDLFNPLWWLTPMSRSFPAAIGDTLEYLADEYEA